MLSKYIQKRLATETGTGKGNATKKDYKNTFFNVSIYF